MCIYNIEPCFPQILAVTYSLGRACWTSRVFTMEPPEPPTPGAPPDDGDPSNCNSSGNRDEPRSILIVLSNDIGFW